MIIISDTIEYTEKVLEQKLDWQQQKNFKLPPVINKLCKRFFKGGKVFVSNKISSALCKFTFIVKHASQSQFTILMEVLRDNNFSEGILCLAESGTNFKGYRNRKWQTLAGNLHLSLFLNPNCKIDNFNIGFTILATVSVVEALNVIDDLKGKSAIKWVNDIFIKDSKISGVLTQTQTTGDRVTGVFLGIGLNVEVTPKISKDLIVPKAACLRDFNKDSSVCRQSIVLHNLLDKLESNYQKLLQNRLLDLLDLYRDNSLVIGRNVKIYSDPVEGKSEFVTEGKVNFIGENLELHLENSTKPITKGRIVLTG